MLVRNYKKAKISFIKLAIKWFNWEDAFNGKDVDSQVKLFNKTFMNIFSNFIHTQIKTFVDGLSPLINDDSKSKVEA